MKKAKTADGKVKFTMKPVVKLVKGKNMKGGEYFWNSESIKAALKRTAAPAPEIYDNQNIYGILLTDENDDHGKFNMLNLNALKEQGNFDYPVQLNELFYRRRLGVDFFKAEDEDPTVCLLNKNNEWVKFEYRAGKEGIRAAGYDMGIYGPLIISDVNITGENLKKGDIYKSTNINVSEYLRSRLTNNIYKNTTAKLQFTGINTIQTTWEKVPTTGGKRKLKSRK